MTESKTSYYKDIYCISIDKNRLDLQLIHAFLSQSYQAKDRTLKQVTDSIEHPLCFGIYAENQQIGFARVTTGYSTFAYLADVFILPAYRGCGLGKWLIHCVLNMPELSYVVTWFLLTNDTQQLYKKFGFELFPFPECVMAKKKDSG